MWMERFPKAGPDSFLFPFHRVGYAGNSRQPVLYGVDLTRPMGSWRKAWRVASKAAGVAYRPHDVRHTFISRLAENPNVRPCSRVKGLKYPTVGALYPPYRSSNTI